MNGKTIIQKAGLGLGLSVCLLLFDVSNGLAAWWNQAPIMYGRPGNAVMNIDCATAPAGSHMNKQGDAMGVIPGWWVRGYRWGDWPGWVPSENARIDSCFFSHWGPTNSPNAYLNGYQVNYKVGAVVYDTNGLRESNGTMKWPAGLIFGSPWPLPAQQVGPLIVYFQDPNNLTRLVIQHVLHMGPGDETTLYSICPSPCVHYNSGQNMWTYSIKMSPAPQYVWQVYNIFVNNELPAAIAAANAHVDSVPSNKLNLATLQMLSFEHNWELANAAGTSWHVYLGLLN